MARGLDLERIGQFSKLGFTFKSDGAQITKGGVEHTSAGLQCTDLNAIDPIEGD